MSVSQKWLCALLCMALLGSSVALSAQPGEIILTPEELYAEAAVLIDADTGQILFDKNADRAMFPASTTKIMTCLLAVEAGDLDRMVVAPKEVSQAPKGSSLMPVQVGEELTMRELLYGLMLPSGNDAANAVAVLVAGSLEAFVERMNQRAAQLGLTGTHFVNAHGFHDDSHYTTARDLAVLAQEAMKQPDFAQIVGTFGYIVEPTNKRKERLKMPNSNLMLQSGSQYYCQSVTGIKTGFTNAAGQTFVFSASQDGANLIGVVLKSGAEKDAPQRWEDARRLIDYGFSRYRAFSFAELYAMSPATVQIGNAAEADPFSGQLSLSIANVSGAYRIACLDEDPTQALADFRAKVAYSLSADPVAPIAAGTILGTMTIASPDGQQASATLVASRSVDAQPEPVTIGDFLPFLAGVDMTGFLSVCKYAGIGLLALLLVRGVVNARREARRRKARRRGRRGASAGYYRNGRYHR